MRECLIRLYYTLGEIQSQKERSETSALQKELTKVNQQVEELKKENRRLREELDHIKKKIGTVFTSRISKDIRKHRSSSRKTDTETKKNKKEKGIDKDKDNDEAEEKLATGYKFTRGKR